jgi:hypothetical protein
MEMIQWLEKQLNIKEPKDWYKITKDSIYRIGGGDLFEGKDESLADILSEIYPNMEWKPWQFQRPPNGLWEDKKNRREFFDWMAKRSNIDHPDGWYSITKSDIDEYGGGGLLKRYYGGSPFKALKVFLVWNNFFRNKSYSWKGRLSRSGLACLEI